jgi:hypothetical protein
VQQSTPSTPTVKQAVTQSNERDKADGERENKSIIAPLTSSSRDCTPTNPKNEHANTNPNDEKNDPLYRWYLRASILGVVATWITLLFFIRQTIHLQQSVEIGRRTARDTRRALQLTQAAEVMLDQISVIDDKGIVGIQPGGQIKLAFKNFGHTKAIDVEIKASLFVEGFNEIKPNELPVCTIGAGDTLTMSFKPMSLMFPWPILNEIGIGNRKMRVEGTISYKDVFNKRHTSTFSPNYFAPTRSFNR